MLKKTKLISMIFVLNLAACSSNSKNLDNDTEVPVGLPEITESKVNYEKAARLNVELGLSYLQQGQIARSKSKFNRAKNLAPDLPEVHLAYAYFHEKVGEKEAAAKSYQKAISLNSKDANAHNNYGAFLCRQHRFAEAEKEFLAALKDPNYPNTAEALENAGLCSLLIPNEIKAQDYLERALRYDGKRYNALLELALIYHKHKNISLAQNYYQRYLDNGPLTARSLLLGVELAKARGDELKAAHYQKLLNKHYPGTPPSMLYSLKG